MLGLILGYCPYLVKEIEGICCGGRNTLEIYNDTQDLLDRLTDPGLPAPNVVFLNTDGSFSSAAARVINKAKSVDSRITTVAVTGGSTNTRQTQAADFALTLPEDLSRLPEILAEADPAAQAIITRRELEQKLTDAQRKMQTILDRLTEGIAVIDASGRIIRVNRKLAEIYGAQNPSAFLGKRCHQALWNLPGPCDNCPKLSPTETVETARELCIGDRTLHLDVSAAELYNGRGEIIGIIESIRDATPRLKLEESLLESEKMKSIGLMAAGLAHELRNPITVINSTAEYCLEIQDDEELERGFESILNAAGQAEKVIRELLNYARPAPTRFEAVSVPELLRTTAGMIAAQCMAQQVELILELPPSLRPVSADRSRLQQALLNFMLNGIQAMDNGGTLTVTAESTEETVEMRISDTGRGMTARELECVFDPFFTTRRGGVGLGMPNAKRVVTAHRGHISLDSVTGKGTTVTIVLPAAQHIEHAAVEIA